MRIEKVVLVPRTEGKFKGIKMSRSSSNEQPLEHCQREDVPQTKRKRSTTNCHQCHRNNRGRVYRCNNCSKQYCIPCIDSWYSKTKGVLFMKEVLSAEACPFCLNFCNCGACLQKKGPSKIQDLNFSPEEKKNLLAYTINVLLPSLKTQVEAETQENKVLQLLERADTIVRLYESTDGQQTLQTSCSCLPCDAGSNNFFKAASREDETENHIYSPLVAETKKSDPHFQTHFSHGQPIRVHGVMTGRFDLSWESTVLERAIRASNPTDLDLSVINCANWRKEKIKIKDFFCGYRNNVLNYQGNPKVLKLEWHSSEMFQNRMPSHYKKLSSCLPFKHYIHPMSECLNDVSMCISYGGSSIELHYGMSDRVSILVDVSSKTLQDLDAGAEWDIFRKKDIPKLEDYISKHAEELRSNIPLRQVVHPNQQPQVYLTMKHKKKLKDEYGIEPWTLLQKLGDAIFVPAGCYYQMRNLQSCIHVAVNFFMPGSLSESGKLFEGRRYVPSDDFQKKFTLKVKELTLNVIDQAVESWEKIP